MTIPNTNEITQFLHCSKCIDELPGDESPRSYARYEIGFTEIGLQMWCQRHECNIVHIDFEGHQHPANTSPEIRVSLKRIK